MRSFGRADSSELPRKLLDGPRNQICHGARGPGVRGASGEDPYGFIGCFQAFNGNKKSADELAQELFDAYRKNKQTQRRMSEVLVGLFEQSGSFVEAKVRIGYLEDLELWEPSFSTRIRSADKNNSQIYGAWGVSDRVATLIKKWAKTGSKPAFEN